MGEALSNIIVESEEAHFRVNQVPRLRLVKGDSQHVEFQDFSRYLQETIASLQTWIASYKAARFQFRESWGYLIFKSLLQDIAEYVVLCRKNGKRLNSTQIRILTSTLNQSKSLKFYLEGAKLALLLETQDALTDSELFYLVQNETEEDESFGPLNTYPEKVIQELFEFVEQNYRKQIEDRQSRKSMFRMICSFLVPIIGFMIWE